MKFSPSGFQSQMFRESTQGRQIPVWVSLPSPFQQHPSLPPTDSLMAPFSCEICSPSLPVIFWLIYTYVIVNLVVSLRWIVVRVVLFCHLLWNSSIIILKILLYFSFLSFLFPFPFPFFLAFFFLFPDETFAVILGFTTMYVMCGYIGVLLFLMI